MTLIGGHCSMDGRTCGKLILEYPKSHYLCHSSHGYKLEFYSPILITVNASLTNSHLLYLFIFITSP